MHNSHWFTPAIQRIWLIFLFSPSSIVHHECVGNGLNVRVVPLAIANANMIVLDVLCGRVRMLLVSVSSRIDRGHQKLPFA